MFTKNKEPMTLEGQVHTTTDYFMFKPIDGNRNKNKLHLKRLKDSMEKNYLFTIILVNENYEIIDGQHRFTVIEELGLPLHYVKVKGYGLREVQILNTVSKKWNTDDYLDGYCNMGFQEYITYKTFKEKYGFGHQESIGMLIGVKSDIAQNKFQDFFNGDFKIKNLQEAEKMADLILAIKPYYEGYKRKSFVYAMLKLFNNPNFEFVEFISKLKIQPAALQNCTNSDQYISMIEEIYNYKRRDKLNLRY